MNSPSYPSAGSLPYQPRPRTWFDKNWKWFVPMIVVVGALVIAAFVGAVLYGVESMFRSSYPYQLAVQRATASPASPRKSGNRSTSAGSCLVTSTSAGPRAVPQ